MTSHTPVDVLFFASDLTPRWYSENTIVSDLDKKYMSDEEYEQYLVEIETRCPTKNRLTSFIDDIITTQNHPFIRSYAVYKLAHECRKHGYSVQVIDHFRYATEQQINDIIDKFVGDNTLMVGFSKTFDSDVDYFFSSFYIPSGRQHLVIERIKRNNYNTKIALGGSYQNTDTMHSESILKKYTDIQNTGYGDCTIIEILDDLKNKKHEKYYRDPLSRLDIKQSTMSYADEDLVSSDIQLSLETSRGCIFKCSFCNFGLLGKEKGSYIRCTERIEQELLENYNKYGVYRYWITDDTFNDDSDKLKIIADLRNKTGIPLELTAFLRLDLQQRLKQEQLLLDCGIKYAQYGIETLNPESAVAINKGWHPDEQMSYIADLKSSTSHFKDVHINSGFIAGLPEDTPQTLTDMRRKLCDPNYNKMDNCFMGPLYMRSPKIQNVINSNEGTGSEIDRNPEKYGYSFKEKDNENYFVRFNWVNKHGLTFNDCVKYAIKFNITFCNSRKFGGQHNGSFTRISNNAKPTNRYYDYLDNYWRNLLSIESHTRY